jgi:hypothetical protein
MLFHKRCAALSEAIGQSGTPFIKIRGVPLLFLINLGISCGDISESFVLTKKVIKQLAARYFSICT